jgi:hypothetical protein
MFSPGTVRIPRNAVLSQHRRGATTHEIPATA